MSTDPALAAAPAAFDEQPHEYDAILLLGFGGPEGQDDVIPFLRNVTRGRGIPDERLEEVAHHYRHFGGVSPINRQNHELRDALAAELDRRGIDLPVLWGNRNWDPTLPDALREAEAHGFRRILALATSAYASYSGCKQYQENIDDALAETGLAGRLTIDKARPYFDHPGFIAPFVEALRGGIAELREKIPGLDPAQDVRILFATHSVPNSYTGDFGPHPEALGGAGAYEAQHLAVSAAVAEAAGEGAAWDLVYQSRSGPAHQPWLEPDINDFIAEIPEGSAKAIVIVPVGFVSDHMEVLWDLDTEAIETAGEHGLEVVRVPTPGTHPAYVSGLIDLVLERSDGTPVAERASELALGPWFDVCGEGCCDTEERQAAVRAHRARAMQAADA
ncbi:MULTISPECIES: ferrochelatase [unclassified Leucobacter]|uniref:ferrochelatase n=1 Tax=unclassified Leucobacter TaxID=2621730 RepID=UPI000620EA85|nr:ferrochelatase [Leucobacter sp. Ag1]KKI17082.1 ferrochelatase [Leucobacter sp. Ag1]